MKRFAVVLVAFGCLSPNVSADDPVDFNEQIRPLFDTHCVHCHGADRQKAKLRLDLKAEVFAGEAADWVIQPGHSANSELIKRISLPADDPDVMPADADPLPEADVALIKRWIDEGAEWPDPLPEPTVDFRTEVQPIFEQHCYHCHGEQKQKGKLRLDQRDGMASVVSEGDPDASELLKRIALPADDPDVMPADDDPLDADKIALITTWIAEGAVWPEPVERPAGLVDYDADVAPIFAASCVECHGPDRQKGDLRFDSRDAVFGPDPEAWVIKPGDPATSLLIQRVSLPADDVDIMPAKGDTLTAEQIAILTTWIEEGAYWPPATPRDPAVGALSATIELPELTALQAERDAAAAERVQSRGALALRVAADTAARDVNFSLLGAEVGDTDLDVLDGLQPTLAWLNLGRTSVTSAGVARLADFTQLRRVQLQETAVDDDALTTLATLPSLEALNLFGTSVTDAGLVALHDCTPLRRVYLWRTEVTEEGVAALEAANPMLVVVWRPGFHVEPAPATPVESPADGG